MKKVLFVRKVIRAVIVGIIMCVSMSACMGNGEKSKDFDTVNNQNEVYNQPNESDIAKSLAEKNIKGLNDTDYKITSVKISKYKIEDEGVHYWCTITSENEKMKASAELDVIFDYYEKGGWLIDNVSDYSNVKYTPKCGVDEKVALAYTTHRYYNKFNTEFKNASNIILEKQNTDLQNGVDELEFSYIANYDFYDEKAYFIVKYIFNESDGWRFKDFIDLASKVTEYHFVEKIIIIVTEMNYGIINLNNVTLIIR